MLGPTKFSTVKEAQEKIEFEAVQLSKMVGCKCEKTRCLRLHCSCFKQGRQCIAECKCVECLNNDNFPEARQFVMHYTSEMNNYAFIPSVVKFEDSNNLIYRPGCNCKKSNCSKKYCECFKFGAKCTSLCKCTDCQSKEPLLEEDKKASLRMKSRRKKLRLLIPRAENSTVKGPNPTASNEIYLVKVKR